MKSLKDQQLENEEIIKIIDEIRNSNSSYYDIIENVILVLKELKSDDLFLTTLIWTLLDGDLKRKLMADLNNNWAIGSQISMFRNVIESNKKDILRLEKLTGFTKPEEMFDF